MKIKQRIKLLRINSNSPIKFIKAKKICGIYDKDNIYFWLHHGRTKEDYMMLAKQSIVLFQKWLDGKDIDQILSDPECKDFAGAFLSKKQIISVRKCGFFKYSLISDGRHRTLAAQELNIYIPIIIEHN